MTFFWHLRVQYRYKYKYTVFQSKLTFLCDILLRAQSKKANGVATIFQGGPLWNFSEIFQKISFSEEPASDWLKRNLKFIWTSSYILDSNNLLSRNFFSNSNNVLSRKNILDYFGKSCWLQTVATNQQQNWFWRTVCCL